MAAMTRGPLPPSVYWRRRLVVLTVGLVVIWSLVHLLGGGSDDTPKAAPAAAITSDTPQPSPSGSPTGDTTLVPATGAASPPTSATPSTSPTPTVLPTPTGPCAPSDVSVTPSVGTATAGSAVTVVLNLQTFNTPACTWQVDHKTMQVKITTAKGDDIWSTVQCKNALPSSTVTLYKDQPTPVTMTWSSKEADAACDGHTDWAPIGAYQVTGVALGGEPDDASFELAAPTPPTPSTTPSATTSTTPTTKPSTKSTSKPSTGSTPSTTPTAKVKSKHVVAD
jgi:hypothetical protein